MRVWRGTKKTRERRESCSPASQEATSLSSFALILPLGRLVRPQSCRGFSVIQADAGELRGKGWGGGVHEKDEEGNRENRNRSRGKGDCLNNVSSLETRREIRCLGGLSSSGGDGWGWGEGGGTEVKTEL